METRELNFVEASQDLERLAHEVEAFSSGAAARIVYYQRKLREVNPESQPLEYEACTHNLLRWLDIRRSLVTIGFTD